jgi:hypothetical protein
MRFSSLRRTAVLTLTAVTVAGSSGCFGSFNVTRKLYNFNKTVSPNKFVQEVVFLAFNIVPVYGVAGAADALVANTVEFWTGKNPVQVASRIQLDKDTRLERVVYEKDGSRFMTIRAFKSDKLLSTTTMQVVIGTDDLRYETVLPSGRRAADVIRMTPDGSAVALGENAQH